ncbi:CubicO group peptidase, beta-lactamase class C family [Pseudozobellia thermophila]|uniref:CubicO group peptidase, beta-lactamase class C family n=2 Tax=Pseudozobellia thermophila TaxID=192903 RepID=A0A1M6JIA4_9FLAO|nr:CubicO group peptidase, beta-lactamase class C family [Pseudozobellia thermophila]
MGESKELKGMALADDLLLGLVNEKRVPGLAITVLKKGQVFYQKGYGHAEMETKVRVDPKYSVFRIASVSKPISATALGVMVEDGIIDLDASFYDYVPYYPRKKWDFTIRQLAGHTAGIRGYQGMEYGLDQAYSIKEGTVLFENDDLLFEPGTGYLYNSFDWVLVSLAMQEASGMAFETYVEERVLKPLGMRHTFAPNRENSIDRYFEEAKREQPKLNRTHYYSKNRSGFRDALRVNNHYKLAGGGYLSTSADIARLGQAYLEGSILSKNTRGQFLSAQSVNGKSTYYGLGWEVSIDAKGRPYYGHVGNGVGGYSNFYVYPDQGMVFSILINCTDPKVQDELNAVVDALIMATD